MRCPACEAALGFIEGATDMSAQCLGCGAIYPLRGGIWRMLTPEQQARYAAFVSGYQAIRTREGWERSAEYYLRLPDVPASDPTAPVWRIRRRSLEALRGN